MVHVHQDEKRLVDWRVPHGKGTVCGYKPGKVHFYVGGCSNWARPRQHTFPSFFRSTLSSSRLPEANVDEGAHRCLFVPRKCLRCPPTLCRIAMRGHGCPPGAVAAKRVAIGRILWGYRKVLPDWFSSSSERTVASQPELGPIRIPRTVSTWPRKSPGFATRTTKIHMDQIGTWAPRQLPYGEGFSVVANPAPQYKRCISESGTIKTADLILLSSPLTSPTGHVQL